jgi:hypothetical protein
MDKKRFEVQIERLKREWKTAYGEERLALFWFHLKKMDDDFMADAVDDFIANRRSPPMLNDFLDFETEYSRRKSARRTVRDSDIHAQLNAWANVSPNKEFAKRCTLLIKKVHSGQINKSDFKIAADALYEEALAGRCKYCEGTGVMYAHNKTNNYRYAFQCDCKGCRVNIDLPLWDDTNQGSFSRV